MFSPWAFMVNNRTSRPLVGSLQATRVFLEICSAMWFYILGFNDLDIRSTSLARGSMPLVSEERIPSDARQDQVGARATSGNLEPSSFPIRYISIGNSDSDWSKKCLKWCCNLVPACTRSARPWSTGSLSLGNVSRQVENWVTILSQAGSSCFDVKTSIDNVSTRLHNSLARLRALHVFNRQFDCQQWDSGDYKWSPGTHCQAA